MEYNFRQGQFEFHKVLYYLTPCIRLIHDRLATLHHSLVKFVQLVFTGHRLSIVIFLERASSANFHRGILRTVNFRLVFNLI